MAHSILKKSICILAASCLALLAQSSDAEAWQPRRTNNDRGYMVGTYMIDNPASSRNHPMYPFAGRNRNLPWRYFMHGVKDSNGLPIAWNVLGSPQQLKKYLDAETIINEPAKRSNLPSIRLADGESVELAVPVFGPKKLKQLGGETLRFYIWIKGDGTGSGSTLWEAAPSISFALYDRDGDLHKVYKPVFKTRGTFPWFCYYMDISIPANIPLTAAKKGPAKQEDAFSEFALSLGENASDEQKHPAGLFVKLENPASGTAWFSTLSYELIRGDAILTSLRDKSALVDPVTGSLAPNPDHDELPMHLLFGLADGKKWTFLQGTKTQPGLTKVAQLEKYLSAYGSDWAHALFGVANLPYLKANATILDETIKFEAEWDDALLEQLLSMQQLSGNGFWSIDNTPNLFLTSAIVSRCFSPEAPRRADRAQAEQTPWFAIKGNTLKQADKLIETLCEAQQLLEDSKEKGGWNNFAFQAQLQDMPEQLSPCDFPATVAAAAILHRAIPLASAPVAARGRKALQDAWQYVMKNMLNADLTWKNTAIRTQSTPSYDFFCFIENTPYLEFRAGKELKALALKPKFTEKAVSFAWKGTRPFVSLRVFVVPADTKPEELDESRLTAIVQPKTFDITAHDPILAVRKIANAAKAVWGISVADAEAPYVASKLSRLPKGFKVIERDGTISVPYVTTAEKPMAVYVAAVTAYGEMTPYVRLEKALPPPAAAPAEGEAAAQ